MPAIDLGQETKTLSRYDVVGQRAEGRGRFVKHVGLVAEDNQAVKEGDEISAVHMRPPLEQGGVVNVHVAGRVPLTNDERKKIGTWVEKVDDECPASWFRQYVVHPPWKDMYNSRTGVRKYRRYSCAGFVLDGYRQANIELLKIEEDAFPPVDKQTLLSAYPDVNTSPSLLLYWGLEGNGPWNVVLAGYVLHALDRPTNEIREKPYKVQKGDEKF